MERACVGPCPQPSMHRSYAQVVCMSSLDGGQGLQEAATPSATRRAADPSAGMTEMPVVPSVGRPRAARSSGCPATRPGGSGRTGRSRGAAAPRRRRPTWTARCARIAPARDVHEHESEGEPGRDRGRPSRRGARRGERVQGRSRPHRPRCRRPACATWRAAMVVPSGAQKKATTGPSRSVADVARRRRPASRSGPTGRATARPGWAGAMKASSEPVGPKSMAAPPKTSSGVRIGPVAGLEDDRCGVPSPGPTYARNRPSRGDRRERGIARPRRSPVRPTTPSGPTSPKNAPGSAPPLWTSSRSASAHAQYIGDPARIALAAALPSAGTRRSARPSGSVVRNVRRCAVGRPVEVERRMVRAASRPSPESPVAAPSGATVKTSIRAPSACPRAAIGSPSGDQAGKA